MARVSAADLTHALKGAHFPMNTRQLLEHARKNRANEGVIETIKDFGEQEFQSLAGVEHAFSQTQRGEPSGGGATQAARKGGHH